MKQDTSDHYGSVSRFFHWLIAVLVINQFLKFADRINEGEHWLADTFGPYHVSIGATVMLLAILRLLWSRKNKPHRPANTGTLGVLANLSHKVMYFCLIAMPPLGALYVQGHGYAVKIYGFTVLPKPADKIGWAHDIGELHSVLAFVLVFLVIMHIGAALYHHFIRKDDVLKRMIS